MCFLIRFMNIDLRNIDCIELLKSLDDNSVDHCITDFPYNVGFDYGNNSDKQQINDYLIWIDDICFNLKRVLKPNSNFVFFIGEKYLPEKLQVISKHFNYEWVINWYKPNAMQFGKTGYSVQTLIFWYSKEKGKIFEKVRDLISYPIIPNENNFGHPSPKPEKVINKLVNWFSRENETVIDLFLGSGTTAISCLKYNRNFIGCEINKDYFEISNNRLLNEQSQYRLSL
jgi:site-specific DNA-methyltransferase (adenine-specific)